MLKDELKAHLTGKILPFWLGLQDRENGGWYGYVDKELRVDRKADKGCILHSRILWAFSTAARVLGDPTYRAAAERAYAAMAAFEDRENGGVFWSVTADGKPKDTTKHTYCQAFFVYGLAAYIRMGGTYADDARRKALSLFDLIETRCSDPGGYGEAFRLDFSPESNEKLSENGVMAGRTMNTLLHVLEAYAELFRALPGEKAVQDAGVRALDRFLNVMYDRDRHRLDVFFDRDYRPLLDMQSYGHDIEASWLLWDAAETLLSQDRLPPFRAMCADLARSVMYRAMTDHGLRNECVDGVNDETRIWWVQAEALLGFDNGWRLTGDPLFLSARDAQWQAIQRLIVDRRPGGEWYWSVHEDGSPTERPMVEEWKCPYHNSRMCLRILELD